MTLVEVAPSKIEDYNLITDAAGLDEAIMTLSAGRFLCFDVETMGDHRGDTWRNNVTWIALANEFYSCVIPMGHPHGEFVEAEMSLKDSADLRDRIARGLAPRKSDYSTDLKKANIVWTPAPEQLTRTEVFTALRPMFGDPNLLKVGHNLCFDLGAVTKYHGSIPAGPYADTMIAAFLIDSGTGYGFGLADVAKKYAGIHMVKGVGKMIEAHGFEEVAKYAHLDVVATAKTWMIMEPLIERDNLLKVFALEMDVLPVVTQMRLTGTPVDTEALIVLRDRLEIDIEEAKAAVFRLAGRKFNINATNEKNHLLYGPKNEGGRGLKPKMLTTGGKAKKRAGEPVTLGDYSVSADAVESYRGSDILVDALLAYSDIAKLMSTYVIPYLGGDRVHTVNGKSKTTTQVALLDKGRLHTDFNQIGAATGRFSSRNPNLQNVPNASTDYGRLIRSLFIAPEGQKLVVADYSQIEPRMIASFSKDPIMLDTYRTGGDIYTTIGNTMGVNRSAGKTLVLSIAYGVGPDKIATSIGCSVEEAKDLLERFGDEFKNIPRLKALTIRTAKRNTPIPYVGTITGRRRYLPDLNSPVWWQVAKAERQCFNTLIQGSAADVMKMALVRASKEIPPEARLTLTVHDELVTTTPAHLAEETAECIRSAMEGITFLRVPLIADVKIVDKWGEAK